VRIYRYRRALDERPRIAVSVDGPAVDLADAWAELRGAEEPSPAAARALRSVSDLIRQGPDLWTEVADVARASEAAEALSSDGLHWLAPLVPASLRDFLCFEDHVKRAAERRGSDVPGYWYEAPVCYKGNPRSIIGPDDECPWPPYTERLDFELELAMIVGRRGRDIAGADAAGYIFGFTVFDDFSARDVQAKEMSAWLGPAKAKDFANALGPCIVTVDELGPEPDLTMECRVNGHVWGRARSSDMHWSWADIIAHVSAAEDVWPGDVYGSGTPGGCCGLDLGRELRPGDVVELEIEKIGVLRNTIGGRAAAS
jgi:2-keto-4-pentenoate hydratase/2-oxohepta-3-ene-1,7-dioic acid hydratase in catechol pathway